MAGVRPVRQGICRWFRAHPAVGQILWRARIVLPVVAGLFAQPLRGVQRGLAAHPQSLALPVGQNTQTVGQSAFRENIPLYRNSELADIARTPAQGRGAY